MVQGGIAVKRRQAAQTETAGMQVLRLSIEDVYGGMIPDRAKEDASLPILAASIAKHGLLQPIVVQKNETAGRYKLVCGTRRLEACRMLGKKVIDAFLLQGDKLDAAACFLEEHMTRKPVAFMESAALFSSPGIMSRCVLPPQTATRYTRMLALDEQTRQAVDSLTLEQAEPLLEAAQIIMQRELTPMQVRRLVLQRVSIQEKATGKRRAVRSVMENMQRICDELNAQGISASVGIHTQNQGICMQIFIKNG